MHSILKYVNIPYKLLSVFSAMAQTHMEFKLGQPKLVQTKQSQRLDNEKSILAIIVKASEDLKAGELKDDILTKPFLDICKALIIVLERLGPTMSAIKADVSGNIHRLEEMSRKGKPEYKLLYQIVRDEAAESIAKKPSSCTKAILWLTRAMEFTVELLRGLCDNPHWTLKNAVEAAYTNTLKPWHGWISVAAYNVGLKLVPEREKFTEILSCKDAQNEREDLEKFISVLSPVIKNNQDFLQNLRLYRLKSA